MRMLPLLAKRKTMPYRVNAEPKAPVRKYFSPASEEAGMLRKKPAST